MQRIRTVGAAIVLFLMLGNAFSAERIALVIGNSNYSHATRLANPGNDASDISAALERAGFEVTNAKDLNFDTMRRALRNFSDKATNADMAIVFYAGHGMEVEKQNYLIPIDARLKTDRDISYEAIPLDLVTEAVSGAKTLKLVMLDACRNNPFAASMIAQNSSRSIGRGLARMEPEAGTLVSFAAKEGTLAADGGGRNSPYTKALLQHLATPGLEINFLFREVRDSVMQDTNRAQQPFTYGSLGRQRIYLNSVPATQPKPQKPANTAVTVKPSNTGALELALWSEVKDSKDADLLDDYLKRFPDGTFSKVAKRKLQTLALVKKKSQAQQPKIEKSEGQRATKKSDPSDVNSLLVLAYSYEAGTGGKKDFSEAARLYRLAADQGSKEAQANLGNMYKEGQGVPKDIKQAVKWYTAAAVQGLERAEQQVGSFYEKGSGVDKDYKEAMFWYQKAAKQGYAPAQVSIAWLHYYGLGYPKDFSKAAIWYQKAADQGYSFAQFQLGAQYHDGEGVAKDDQVAALHISNAIGNGNEYALSRITTKPTEWSKALRVELQRVLKNSGHYSDKLDGSFGPDTVAAMKKFLGSKKR